MSCPHTHDAAAYVLGALSPAERLDFERHLDGCDECRRAVGELAGLPGLLGRLDASALEKASHDEEVPDTLLPALVREVRAKRRRTLAAAAAVAAVVAVIASLLLWQAADDTEEPPPSGVVAREMEPVGEVPVQATLSMEEVAWGTKLGLTCTYDPSAVTFELPDTVPYALVVRTRDGREERVGTWVSEVNRTIRFEAGTAEAPGDIASVEVRTLDDRVVLQLLS